MSRNVIRNISKFSNAEEILDKCLGLLCINDVEVQIKQSSLISKSIASFSGVMQKCPYGDNIYELILDANMGDDKLMKNVILHECCHLKQMVEGRLIVNTEENTVIFEGKEYPYYSYSQYTPWEEEAFDTQRKLIKEV